LTPITHISRGFFQELPVHPQLRVLDLQPLQLGSFIDIQRRRWISVSSPLLGHHQRPSSASPTPISFATWTIGRPVSITSRAASRRYAGV
jgi:hypothetical protein